VPQAVGKKLSRYSLEISDPLIAPAIDPVIANVIKKTSGSSLCASFARLPDLSVGCNEKSFSSTSISSDTFRKVSHFFQADSITRIQN
jgi:hypothetical protein